MAAWDAEQDRITRAATVEERKQLGKRLAAADALMQVKGPGKVRTYVDRIDRDGNEVPLRPDQQHVDQMSITEAIRLIEVGSRLEAVGRGGLADRPLSEPEAIGGETGSVPQENPILAAVQLNPAAADEITAALRQVAALVMPEPR